MPAYKILKNHKIMKGKTLALLALGAAVVLLFTTDKGKKIRDGIQDKAEDWGDHLGDLGATAAKEISALREKLMEEIENVSSDVRSRLTDVLEEGKEKGKKLTKMGRERLS